MASGAENKKKDLKHSHRVSTGEYKKHAARTAKNKARNIKMNKKQGDMFAGVSRTQESYKAVK